MKRERGREREGRGGRGGEGEQGRDGESKGEMGRARERELFARMQYKYCSVVLVVIND